MISLMMTSGLRNAALPVPGVGLATARRDRSHRWNHEFVRVRIVAQRAPRKVEGLVAVIVEFDEIQLGVVRVREEFVDEDVPQGVGRDRVEPARRTADRVARRPGARVVFPEGGSREYQRMTRAVRGRRPGRLAVVIDFEKDRADPVAQPDGAGRVGQVVGERSEHAADAIDALHVRRRSRHDQETAAAQDGARREPVINAAGESESAQVFRGAEGIKELDEFEAVGDEALRVGVARAARVAGMIHDFRNHQAGFAARLTEGLEGWWRRAARGAGGGGKKGAAVEILLDVVGAGVSIHGRERPPVDDRENQSEPAGTKTDRPSKAKRRIKHVNGTASHNLRKKSRFKKFPERPEDSGLRISPLTIVSRAAALARTPIPN